MTPVGQIVHLTKQLFLLLIEYEFRVAGINNVGPGQEAIALYLTPEGMPTDSPKNITTRFQTPDVIEISYDPTCLICRRSRSEMLGKSCQEKPLGKQRTYGTRACISQKRYRVVFCCIKRPKNPPSPLVDTTHQPLAPVQHCIKLSFYINALM